MDAIRSPLEKLEAMYVQIAELRNFAEAEWDDMTLTEHSDSDAVIAELDDAADAWADSFYYEILLERLERTHIEFDRHIESMREARERGLFEEAVACETSARDLWEIVGMLNSMLDKEAMREDIEDTL